MHSKLGVSNPSLPLHRQLREAILAMVDSGKVKAGQRIPSVRELIRRYGVSHITVRKCLSDLSGEGVLHKRQGLGTFVTEKPLRRANIALLFPDGRHRNLVSDPYYSLILGGILEGAGDRGMGLSTVLAGETAGMTVARTTS